MYIYIYVHMYKYFLLVFGFFVPLRILLVSFFWLSRYEGQMSKDEQPIKIQRVGAEDGTEFSLAQQKMRWLKWERHSEKLQALRG